MPEETQNEHPHKRRPLEKMSYAEKGRFFFIRNILNIAFILLAIVGMAVYFYTDKYIGGTILIVSIVIKAVECVLRIIR